MVGWSNQINFDYLPSTLTITHETFRTFTTYFTIKPLNIIIHIHDLRKTREILTLMMSGCRSCCFKCPNSVMAVRHHRPCRGREVNHVIIIITSHGENGSRPQRPLYPRNNDRVHFILHKILYYNTTVSDAMEICFVIIHHVLIDPEFI